MAVLIVNVAPRRCAPWPKHLQPLLQGYSMERINSVNACWAHQLYTNHLIRHANRCLVKITAVRAASLVDRDNCMRSIFVISSIKHNLTLCSLLPCFTLFSSLHFQLSFQGHKHRSVCYLPTDSPRWPSGFTHTNAFVKIL